MGKIEFFRTLLDHIHRRIEQLRNVCLVTFNYDRLLEAAMPTVGIHIESMSDYVDSPEYKVIKLHGSVNWGRNIATSPMRELHQLRAEQIPAEVILRAPALLKGKFGYREHGTVEQPTGTTAINIIIPPRMTDAEYDKIIKDITPPTEDTETKLIEGVVVQKRITR